MTPPFHSPVQNPRSKKTLFLALLLGIFLGFFSKPFRVHSQEALSPPEEAQMVANPQGDNEDWTDDEDDLTDEEAAALAKTGVLCHRSHHHHRHHHHHHHHHLHHCHHGPRGAVMLQSETDQDADLTEVDFNQE